METTQTRVILGIEALLMTLQSALPQPFGVFPVLKPFVHPGLVAELNQHIGMVTAQFSLQLLIGTQETGGEGLSGRSVYQ